MERTIHDPIAEFYDRHPYPPPVADLGPQFSATGDRRSARAAHHLVWPERPIESIRSVLVAGCGTAQAVRAAVAHPHAQVVGIDVSSSSLEHGAALAAHHGVTNLSLHELPIERVAELGQQFDHVICTGVLHHLANPLHGLSALRTRLAPAGAITLMVYAPYGRVGIYMIQDYCRRLGISASTGDVAELVETLRELPDAHPIRGVLERSRDFADDEAIADALCNPRDRAYSVPELFDLVDRAGLRFGRWQRQAPYLVTCGAISETPHAGRIADLEPADQYAAVELFRGTIARHTAILYDGDDTTTGALDFSGSIDHWVPIPVPTATAVEERLPPGAAAALINRAHVDTDLVMFVDRQQYSVFRAIDGAHPVSALGTGTRELLRRLWHHDLVVFDTTASSELS